MLPKPKYIILLIFNIFFIFMTVLGENDTNVCYTSECILSAININNSMDTTVDPCDDFYTYACGNWPKNHVATNTMDQRRQENAKEILEFLRQNNQAAEPQLLHKARKLFSLCLDTDELERKGLDPLRELLKSVDLSVTPPLLAQNPKFDYELTQIKAQKQLGIDMFYHITVTSNPYNRTTNIINIKKSQYLQFQLPTLTHSFVQDLKHSKDFNQNRNAYMTSVFHALCLNSTLGVCGKLFNFDEALSIASAINRLEKYNYALITILMKPDTYEQNQQTVSTLGKLQNLTDLMAAEANAVPMNWTKNIEHLFNGAENTKLNIDENLEIVFNKEYIKTMLTFVYTFSPADHELGMWWTVVDSFAPYSVSSLRNEKSKFINRIFGQQTREKWCVNAVSRVFGMTIGHYYRVNQKYNATKYQIAEMIKNIREAFQVLIINTTWMDEQTRKQALNKIQNMKASIAFPDDQRLYDNLDMFYKDVNITDNFLESVLKKIGKDNAFLLRYLNKTNNFTKENFFSVLPPVLVNAFYMYERNALLIPAGLLGFPISGNGLKALDYGAIGFIIGHEMTHGFDVQGRYYNSEGNIENWWDPLTFELFNNKTSCYIQSYNYNSNNGRTTLAENIADNGGFKEALQAYRIHQSRNGPELLLPHLENYTHEQLFTLSFANTWCERASILDEEIAKLGLSSHSMNGIRVNEVASNSKEFSEIWNCKKGSQMYFDDTKCNIW